MTELLSMVISIHASREGSDALLGAMREVSQAISIHASREGSDLGEPEPQES